MILWYDILILQRRAESKSRRIKLEKVKIGSGTISVQKLGQVRKAITDIGDGDAATMKSFQAKLLKCSVEELDTALSQMKDKPRASGIAEKRTKINSAMETVLGHVNAQRGKNSPMGRAVDLLMAEMPGWCAMIQLRQGDQGISLLRGGWSTGEDAFLYDSKRIPNSVAHPNVKTEVPVYVAPEPAPKKGNATPVKKAPKKGVVLNSLSDLAGHADDIVSPDTEEQQIQE